LEEQIRTMLINGQIAEFVKNEQRWSEIGFQAVFELPCGLSGGQGVDDINGGSKQNAVALETSLIAKGSCQMGFAETDTAKKNTVGFLLDKVEQKELLQLLSIDFLGPGPLELIERLGYRKTSHPDAALDGVIPASVGLTLHKVLQIFLMTPVFVRRLCGQASVLLEHKGQFKETELFFHLFFSIHHKPPSDCKCLYPVL
jgi:hypothetical protein